MATYVGLLRAVNVGGRTVRMADLRAGLSEAGFADVETHIQTGNVRFASRHRSPAGAERALERALADVCGFEVPAILLTPEELVGIHADAVAGAAPHPAVRGEVRYVSVFKDGEQPEGADAAAIAAWDRAGEGGRVQGRAVHVWIDGSMHEAAFFRAFARPLAAGTSRNLRVIAALAQKWGRAS